MEQPTESSDWAVLEQPFAIALAQAGKEVIAIDRSEEKIKTYAAIRTMHLLQRILAWKL